MSDVGLPIEGGKYKPYIDSLYRLAETRRKPLEVRLETSQNQRRGWLDANRNLTNLRLALSQLRGAESVFGDRIARSGNENAITVNARRHVQPIDIEVKVDKKAAADRFFSQELLPTFQVPSGTYQFEVGQEPITFTFNGGSLDDFTKQLNNVDSNLLRASVIQSSPDRRTLFLESMVTGQEAKLNFKGLARQFAFDVGLITDKIEARYTVASDNRNQLRLGSSIDIKQPIRLSQGRHLSINTQSDTPLDLKAGAFLSFNYRTIERPAATVNYAQPNENPAVAIREGRLVKEQEPNRLPLPDLQNELNVYLKINGELVPLIALNPSEASQTVKIDLGQLRGEAEAIVLNNSNTRYDIETSNMQLFIPGDVDFIPVNPASIAQNAEFTLDGVRISRPTNTIDDMMPGIEFTVQGPSERAFTVSVKHDVEKANVAIQDFIWAYYLNMAKINTFIAVPSNTDVVDELAFLKEDERLQAKKDLGLFQGDQTFNQLKSRLNMMMMNPYAVGARVDQKLMLAEIGIKTNDRGTPSTAGTRRGYYDIKEPDVLNAALENRWDEVEQLFIGHKEDGSIVATGGLADVMTTFINSYINNGLIRSRTTTLDNTIKRQEKDITDFNDKLDAQRKKWETDFAKAQSAEQEFNRLQRQMDNTFFNNNNR